MIFLDYRQIEIFGVLLLVAVAGIWMFRRVGRNQPLVRISVRLISGLFVGCSSLLFLVAGCFDVTTETIKSEPIYSPDGERAFRVIDNDWGALGGGTLVTVYSHHGLIADVVFSGQFMQTELRNVRWLGNTTVSVGYDKDYGADSYRCNDGHGVAVICAPLLDRER